MSTCSCAPATVSFFCRLNDFAFLDTHPTLTLDSTYVNLILDYITVPALQRVSALPAVNCPHLHPTHKFGSDRPQDATTAFESEWTTYLQSSLRSRRRGDSNERPLLQPESITDAEDLHSRFLVAASPTSANLSAPGSLSGWEPPPLTPKMLTLASSVSGADQPLHRRPPTITPTATCTHPICIACPTSYPH